MEWWEAIVAVCAIVGTTIGAILGVAKLRGENTKIFVDTAEVSIGVVGKSRDMLAADVAELRARTDDMESEISQLRVELRGEKAENIKLTRENEALRIQVAENEHLRARVTDLEAEVRRLKQARQR